jgi:ribonuclease HI
MRITAYTDGACSGNPGPGGWGVVLSCALNGETHTKELSGGSPATTSNAMEMQAILEAVKAIRASGCSVVVFTDSQLAVGYFGGWKCKAPHLTQLKTQILEVIQGKGLDFEVRKVPAHSGVPGNERADRLAVAQRDRFKPSSVAMNTR